MAQSAADGIVLCTDVDSAAARRRAVELSGFATETATSAAAVLDLLEKRDVACLVSGTRLADADAIELIQTIRADRPELPILLVAEHGSEQLASDAISAGVTDYLVDSGDTLETLETRVRAAVDRYRDGPNDTCEGTRTVLEHAPDAIVVTVDGTVVYANPEAATLFGVDAADELVGVSIASRCAGANDLERSLARIECGDRALGQAACTLRRFDTGTVSTEITARGVTWEGQDGAVVVLRDASEQRCHSQQLQERVKELTAVHEVIQLFETRRPFEELLAEFVERIPDSFQYPEHTEVRLDCCGSTVETDGFREHDDVLVAERVAEDGTTLTLEIVYTADAPDDPFLDEERTLLETLVTIVTDYYERRVHLQELEESENRFRQMAENIEEVVWMSDPDKSEILFVNSVYEEIWGRPRESLYADPTSFLDGIHPADRDEIEAVIPRQREGEYDEEYRVVQPDGEVRWVHDRAVPVRERGSVDRIVGIATDITEYKRTQKQLDEHLGRITDAFYALDTNWEFTYLNDTAVRMLERDREALLGERLWDVFPEALGTELEAAHRNALGTQQSVTVEFYYESLETLFELRIYPSPTGLSVYFQDITAKKQRQTDLQRYETTLEALGDPIYALDTDGHLTFVNDALVEKVGYDRPALLGSHVSLIIDDAGVERGREVIQGLLESDEETAKWEMDLLTADGKRIASENHVALLPFSDGRFQGTAGVIRDVTEREQREQQLRLHRDHLVRTEQLAAVGGWEFDLSDDSLYWTQGTREIFEVSDGYEPTVEQAIECYHPEDRPTLREAIERCREEGTPYDLELRLITAKGRERWIQSRGERVEEDGSTKLRGTIQDITRTKERQQQLMVLNRVLRHNLRNNLNVVTAHAELMRSDIGSLERPPGLDKDLLAEISKAVEDSADTIDAADEQIETIQAYLADVFGLPIENARDSLDRIEENVWELLSLAEKARRLAATTERTEVDERVELDAVLSDLVADYRSEFPTATIGYEGTDAVAIGQRRAIRLAVEELLDNAVRHADTAEPTVDISVAKPTSERVTITVADDGPGIPEMELESLEIGAETPLSHGSGLGLWTVNWLLTRLGGSISIGDTESRGSVVRIELPAASENR